MLDSTKGQANNGIIENIVLTTNRLTVKLMADYTMAEAVQYENGATNSISPNPAFSGNVKGIVRMVGIFRQKQNSLPCKQ